MRFIQNNYGSTLIEQLAALLLGTIIITSLFGFYRTELFHLLAQETRMATLEDARGAMDIISRDLKLAGSWGTGSAPAETGLGDDPDGDEDSACNRVYRATERVIQIQMDLNGNGNCADLEPRENIRYELGAPTSTCPGATVLRRNGDCLVAHVTAPNSGKLFRYYDENGSQLSDSPPPAAIKRIGISFSVGMKQTDSKTGASLNSTLSSSVELRN
jgi:type II secretory pathway component PulJ